MDTQRCGTCGVIKPIDEFSFHNRLRQKRHTTCRACQKIHKRNFYERNLEAYKAQSVQQLAAAVERNKHFIHEHLLSHACIDCGESDPVVLEFDHINPKEKDREVTALARAGVSLRKLAAEMNKCEIRCVNCHRVKTASEQGWYRP